MSCRCNDISCVNGKIEKLSQALGKLPSYNGYMQGMLCQVNSVRGSLFAALPQGFAGPVSANMQKRPSYFAPISASANSKISAKLSELRTELEKLRQEDERFHEEEEREKLRRQEAARRGEQTVCLK